MENSQNVEPVGNPSIGQVGGPSQGETTPTEINSDTKALLLGRVIKDVLVNDSGNQALLLDNGRMLIVRPWDCFGPTFFDAATLRSL